MTEIENIKQRDATSGATWFTGPASFTAQAARDRRELLRLISEAQSKLDEQRPLIEKAIRDLAAGAVEVREARNEVLRADTEARRASAYAAALHDALLAITDHFAAVMGGPMVAGRGVTFANGVEGIPTIAKARAELAKAPKMSHPDDRSGHTKPTLASIGIVGEAHAVGRIQRLEIALAAKDRAMKAAQDAVIECNEELSECRRALPDTPEFDFLAGKTLLECIEALVAGVPYAERMRSICEWVRTSRAAGLYEDHPNWEKIDEALAALAKGSDGKGSAHLVVGGAQLAQAGGDSGGMPLSVGRSRPDQTATNSDDALPGHQRKGITMNFGDAIEEVKAGKCVQRAGWNGKGMFVYLNKGSFDHELLGFPMGTTPLRGHPSAIDGISVGLFETGDKGTVTRLPNINMRSASGSTVTGWVASQTDMLAEDWQVIAP